MVSVPLAGTARSPVISSPTACACPRPTVLAVQIGKAAQRTAAVAVKAAFLYNFAKFTEWPALPRSAPIVTCIVGDDGITAAFVATVGGRTVDDHRLVLAAAQDSATWRTCHILFIADGEGPRSADGLTAITRLPVLTVGDTPGFAQAGGIIELYTNEAGQLHFVINVEAAERSGLRLSSKLLTLATIIRPSRSPKR